MTRAGSALLVVAACASSSATPTNPHAKKGMSLEAAELPHRVLRARGGTEIPEDAFLGELAAAQVVCLAERHPNPHHHYGQWMILKKLVERGHRFALGMEMFQTPFQGVLDDYAAKKIDVATLLSRSGWADRWGYDFDLYRPMIDLAVAQGFPILALNAPSEIVKKVARDGLESLSPDQRATLPELDLSDERHRAFFREATEGHGGGMEQRFESFYAAQVIWDETMADVSAGFIAAASSEEPRAVAILAGTGHCHPTGIPSRLARRGVRAVSVVPILDDGEGSVADALAAPDGDYLLVLDATGGGR